MTRKQITAPNLRDTLQAFRQDLKANFNCHRIGIVQSFNAANQTATIKIVDKRILFTYEDAEPILRDYSLLLDCPVFVNASSNAGFTRPIVEGEECLVLFNDRDIDNWFKAGVVGKPRSNRMHDLSDGLALVGFHSLLNSLQNFSTSSTKMYFGASVIELTDKVKIQNAAENLKTIIDDLIDAITSLQVVDPISGNLSITAATATSLANLKTRIATFLTS